MPQTWQMVDTNFPTITGEEPVKEQISKIIDYLAILTEQLQYQLQNLDSSNWNATALESFTDDTTTQFGKKVAALARQVSTLQSTVETLSARVSGAENLSGRVREAEENISYLQNDLDGEGGIKERLGTNEDAVEELQEGFDELKQAIDGEGGMEQRLSKVEQLLTLLQVEENTLTVGGEEKTVHINGAVYINGNMTGQTEESETK